jgi:hypothetical protein
MLVKKILTPLIRSEIPSLLKWIRYCPAPCASDQQKEIIWYLSIDKEWTDFDIAMTKSHIRNSAYCNLSLRFLSLGIPDHQSVYLRNLCRSSHCDLKYGSKSGPNLQFFKSIEKISDEVPEGSDEAIMLLETDAIPIQKNWLNMLNKEIMIGPNFWIAGGKYQGRSLLSESIKDHINGNAIYGIGVKGFRQFLVQWERLLVNAVAKDHWIAYDVVLTKAMQESNNEPFSRQSSIHVERKMLIEAKKMTVDISSLILNVSGNHEVSSKKFDHTMISKTTLVCHSRPLSNMIPWCLTPEKGLNVDSLSYCSNLNRRLTCLSYSKLSYLNYDDPGSFSFNLWEKVARSENFLRSEELIRLTGACMMGLPIKSKQTSK